MAPPRSTHGADLLERLFALETFGIKLGLENISRLCAALDHPERAFTSLLAGAGVKGGYAHGQTDEFGINIVANPVHVHDYHATILHLMGIDLTRLVYRHAGRDFRLTDVDGNVIRGSKSGTEPMPDCTVFKKVVSPVATTASIICSSV